MRPVFRVRVVGSNGLQDAQDRGTGLRKQTFVPPVLLLVNVNYETRVYFPF